MNNTEKKLSEIFDVDYVETNKTEGTVVLPPTENVAKADVAKQEEEFVKKTILQMMIKGQSALEELHSIARDSEKSRDFEVMFNGFKTVAELGQQLLDTGKKEEAPAQQSPQTVNQTAVFVGSTAELAKMISGLPQQNDSESHK